MLEATRAACDQLAAMRFAAMPTSVEEAIALALEGLRRELELLECFHLPPLLQAGERRDDRRLERLTASCEELSMPRLLRLGVIVLRDGYPARPTSDEKRLQAKARLHSTLLEDVCDRLESYQHPCQGRIAVNAIALTP